MATRTSRVALTTRPFLANSRSYLPLGSDRKLSSSGLLTPRVIFRPTLIIADASGCVSLTLEFALKFLDDILRLDQRPRTRRAVDPVRQPSVNPTALAKTRLDDYTVDGLR